MLWRSVVFGGVLVALCLDGIPAAAQSSRSRSRAARMKAVQDQAAYMQLEMLRYQSEMAAITQEIVRSFDEDGDGTLKGPEKSRYDKHMKAIQSGKAPNPFVTVMPVGQGTRPKSPQDELKKRARDLQAGVVAKQQELYNSFDADGDGELKGPEKQKFEKHMRDIQAGKVPNPFADVAAGGSGTADKEAKK